MFKLVSFRSDGAFWPFVERSGIDRAAPPRSGISALLAAPWRLVQALAKEMATRRAMRLLASLDERMLRDIGLDRGHIGFAARRGRIEQLRMQDVRADIVRWS